ncbi:MAG: ATP-binding protein [Polaromonas sp.]|nr:ATP-binding protein [Polaromonas sp.]
MRIKSLLVALVAGIALPLVALAGFITVQLWHQQQSAYAQQFLERANAVRLAIDTEFAVTLRTLRAVGDATEILPADTEEVLLRRFRRLLDNNLQWSAVVLTDNSGRVVMSETRPGIVQVPLLDSGLIRSTISSGEAYISDLTASADGRRVVFVATPVTHRDRTQGVIYAVIDHTHWLTLLREYPVSERGTLTVIDRRAVVVTRTRHDEKWVGTRAPAEFWQEVANRSSGTFDVTSLDGVPLYASFSRSKVSGWILSTGVPKDEVVHALYWQTALVVGVGLIAVMGAMVAAWRLGRSINTAFTGLLISARSLASDTPEPGFHLPIREARTVQKALEEAHHELLAKQSLLNESLEREALARQQAESSSKSKDKFLAMMGHELRNPLSAISSAVELIRADDARPLVAKSSDIIKRQARHLTAMVNDLMDVAQLDAGDIVLQRTHLDLAQVAARVLQRFDETGRCAHLKIRIEHAPAPIFADESRVELLITCLLDNACKYTPPGGDVVLEVTEVHGASVLRIRDTGKGIAPDVAASMFDAFTQGDRGIERSEGGLGLGLALARQLVELHEGEISASSEGAGKGATFTVSFPKADHDAGAQTPLPPSPANDLLLTVVEDIADNRDMLIEFLEGTGRRINGAADGPSAVDTILGGPSDIAVIDIGLPGFSGLEVARRIRRHALDKRVYLIALTGYGTDADRKNAMDAGFDDFLVKPFDPDRFEEAIARALARIAQTG